VRDETQDDELEEADPVYLFILVLLVSAVTLWSVLG
jgi:hypothetical protein